MAHDILETLDTLKNDEKCIFCRQNVMDELLLGKVYRYGEITTHYFCMLFSSQMEQNGKDEEGILGFLPNDVKKEVLRGSKLVCSYCHHEGATIACYIKTCKKKFHYPCAIENGSLHQFYGQFKSFCFSHRRVQNVPQYACKLTEINICVMCQDEVKPKPSLSTIWAPCCKTAWFHRTCVQKMSISAGYFFKCPNCNNKDEFRKEMRDCGIYIPDQDASWELEPNAFNELNERYNFCDLENCECPKGRSYSTSEGIWEIILCILCGSQGIHAKCGKRSLDDAGQWTCSLCAKITSGRPNRVQEENSTETPGPSTESVNNNTIDALHQPNEVVSHNMNVIKINQRYSRRKRNMPPSLSDESQSTSKKILKLNDSVPSSTETNDLNNRTCLYGNSGEQIEVVHLSNIQEPNEKLIEIGGVNVIHEDSDDDDSDIEITERNVENLNSRLTQNHNSFRTEKLNKHDKSESVSFSNIVIDLLEDSDDECCITNENSVNTIPNLRRNISSKLISSSNEAGSVTDNDKEDDDVIFVGCDVSNTDNSEDHASSSALIRFIENNTVFVVSPAEIKKNGSLEALTSVVNHSVLSNAVNSLSSNQSSNNAVWQSIPLHKSIVHSFSQIQTVSSSSENNDSSRSSCLSNNRSSLPRSSQKCCSEEISYSSDKLVTNNRLKEKVQINSWNSDISEIITID